MKMTLLKLDDVHTMILDKIVRKRIPQIAKINKIWATNNLLFN